MLQIQKSIIKQNIPSQRQNRVPIPQQRLPLSSQTPSRSQPKMLPNKDRLDFHLYQSNNEIPSPMFSAELNSSPNIYPQKKNKIRNLKANMQISSPGGNGDMQYDNFFKYRNKKLPYQKPALPNPLARTEPEMGRKPLSGLNSILSSDRQQDEFQYGSGNKFSFKF